MIFGECPNCDATIENEFKEEGLFSRRTCKSCKKRYYLRHSQIAPVAVDEETFLAAYDVDEEKGTITKKDKMLTESQEYMKFIKAKFEESPQGKALKKMNRDFTFQTLTYGYSEFDTEEINNNIRAFFAVNFTFEQWLEDKKKAAKPKLRIV